MTVPEKVKKKIFEAGYFKLTNEVLEMYRELPQLLRDGVLTLEQAEHYSERLYNLAKELNAKAL